MSHSAGPVNLLFRGEFVCVCVIVKKQDSRSMSLLERNQVIAEIVHIWSYPVAKGDKIQNLV